MKTINLSTGTIVIDDESLNFVWEGNNLSIFRKHIGKVNIQTERRMKHPTWQYGFRLGVIGVILIIATFIKPNSLLSWLAFITMFFAIFLVIGDVFFTLIGLPLIDNIMVRLVGENVTVATIQNTNGTDLEFFIAEDEIVIVRGLEKYRL